MRYYLKERVLSVKDDFIVRDEAKNELFEVRGKFFRIGDEFTIHDKSNDQEILRIKQRIFSYTTQYELLRDNVELATVRRRDEQHPHLGPVEINSRDGISFHVRGNFKAWDLDVVDHYGRVLGHIDRRFAILGDHYAVDVSPDVDGPFMIAIAVILDEMKEDGKFKDLD